MPVSIGLLFTGAAELGAKFKIDNRRRPCSVEYPIKTMTVSIVSVPPGTDLDKVNLAFDLVEKAGRYWPWTRLAQPPPEGTSAKPRELRADAHGPDAAQAVDLVKSLP